MSCAVVYYTCRQNASNPRGRVLVRCQSFYFLKQPTPHYSRIFITISVVWVHTLHLVFILLQQYHSYPVGLLIWKSLSFRINSSANFSTTCCVHNKNVMLEMSEWNQVWKKWTWHNMDKVFYTIHHKVCQQIVCLSPFKDKIMLRW